MSDDTDASPAAPSPSPSLAMVVPMPALSQSGNYLRLGVDSVDDELALPIDPLVAGEGAPTVGSKATTPPFGRGTLNYSVDGIKLLGPYGYLRIGDPASYEGWLTPDASQPVTPPVPGTPPRPPVGRTGLLLYSSATVHTLGNAIVSASSAFTSYSNDKLLVTGDAAALVSASLTSGDSKAPFTTSFERLIQLKAQLGSAYGFTVGDSINHVIGGYATVSSGVKLTSNVGQTQNIAAGQMIGVSNAAVKVEGWRASHVAPSPYTLASVEAINLACSPAPAAVETFSTSLMARCVSIGAAISAVLEGGMAVATDSLTAADWRSADIQGDDAADTQMRAVLKDATWEMVSTESLILVLQAMTLITGLAARSAATAAVGAPLASLSMNMGEITMRIGASTMIMTDGAIILDTGAFVVNAAEAIYS